MLYPATNEFQDPTLKFPGILKADFKKQLLLKINNINL